MIVLWKCRLARLKGLSKVGWLSGMKVWVKMINQVDWIVMLGQMKKCKK